MTAQDVEEIERAGAELRTVLHERIEKLRERLIILLTDRFP
jgi:hypothetical protein